MTTPSEPTLINLKTSFLTTQITLLSQPLQPSSSFHSSTTTTTSSTPPLPERAVTTTLQKLHQKIQQHNNLSYAPQAKRNVAEQIDKLYWREGERGVGILGYGEEWGERGCDYRKEELILLLPSTWSTQASTQFPELSTQFSTLQQKLLTLNRQRQLAKERLESSKRLRELLEPFGEEGGVQENLVMKNGEMEGELEKMRRLMLRFERAKEGLGDSREGDGDGDVEMDEGVEDRKVIALLGGGGR